MSDESSLEQRMKRLEDIEEIKQLKATYCHYADRGFAAAGHDDDALAALFVEDGVWEGSVGPSRGHEAISAACKHFLPFGFHLAINPHIEVDGDVAHGRWWGLVPSTNVAGQAIWTAGCYENEFVRTVEGWRFKRLRFRAAFKSRYEAGWASETFAEGLAPVGR